MAKENNEEKAIDPYSEHLEDEFLECSNDEILKQLVEELSREIPNKTEINIPREISADYKIDSFNEKSRDIFLDAFAKSEKQRLASQKPIMIAVIVILALQLVAFNVLIFVLIFKSFFVIQTDTQLFGQLLDFLKYYVGVVILELIGLMVIITKNTFSSQSDKIVDKITSFWKK